jgi:hypothetical protein
VREGGILAKLYKRDGRGNANFRDLYASRLISVAADYNLIEIKANNKKVGIVNEVN